MRIDHREKAQELFNLFIDITEHQDAHWDTYEDAKKCACINIDQIIQACEYNHVETYNTDWWLKVKEAVQEL